MAWKRRGHTSKADQSKLACFGSFRGRRSRMCRDGALTDMASIVQCHGSHGRMTRFASRFAARWELSGSKFSE